MAEHRINVNTCWTPWEHEVCQFCLDDNPYAIWLVKVRCFKPHQHGCSHSRVVIDHKCMAMTSIRTVSTFLWRFGRFKMCRQSPDCSRGDRCLFPHSQYELDMWNIKTRLIRRKTSRKLVSQLCAASLNSQCPSEVCQVCFEANPNALWLTWLRCTDTERHKNKSRVTVVANNREKKLIKVRSLPWMLTQLDEVKRATHDSGACISQACQQAHSEDELLYWKWQVARKTIFVNYSAFSRLCDEYEYPSEQSQIITCVIAEKLTKDNYHSKYHKLIYLEEVESSRRITSECDKKDVHVGVQWSQEDNTRCVGYLLNLGYAAMDYASYNRADVVVTIQNGYRFSTRVLESPDYDECALVLRTIPSKLYPPKHEKRTFMASVHFDISHDQYKHQHNAIENADDCTLAKIFPSNLSTTRSSMTNFSSPRSFPLDEQYQLKALNQMLSCNSEAPYLLLGPFGTGKTYLLAATVSKLTEARENHILVCTHRKRGADNIFKTLQYKSIGNIARMVGSADAAENLRHYGTNAIIPGGEAANYSVLVTTFGVAGNLVELVHGGEMHFSHILIDEGAQCPEPEALGAIVLANEDTKVIIVGDNKQVGPKVRVLSETARDNGLGESVLERLFSHYKEVNRGSLVKTHTSTLLTNYRCHPSILMLASSLFYECTLLSQTKRETHPKYPYPLVFACTSVKQDDYSNCLPENEEEAKLLISKLVEFIRTWPSPPKEPIGVLASTKQQVTCLRELWQREKRTLHEHWKIKVVILPTYNIQGEEFSAVFLSTAEPTNGNGAPIDRLKSICNEFVFNTVITRPQSLIFVAGNPFSLLQMGSHFPTNCWMEYIRRCIQCQSLVPPTVRSPFEAQKLPKIIGQICEKVLLGETIQQAEDQKLTSDDIVERYISDLNKRHEYKLAARLVQSPSGDLSWVEEGSLPPSTRNGIVWCQLDCKDFRNAVARPFDPNSNQEDIKLDISSITSRKGVFHGSKVKIDTIQKCVLFDEETEQALANTHFGVSFPCRVDQKNPILFFPLDSRYPKFANLPMLILKDRTGVVCFDPMTINSTPKMSNFIPLEVAAKTLFMVKFLGWTSKFPYPLGVIVAALPSGNSPYTGELVLRIMNSIPLSPCLVQAPLAEPQCSRRIPSTFTGAFAIDPHGSPDHDDALTCRLVKKEDNGNVKYQVGVHITNVQHYIPKDSELDKEARKRGCAVYRSSSKCISYMLPEALVKDMLSISQGKKTHTLSVVAQFIFDKDNNVQVGAKDVKFEDTQVDCSLQLTYEEAYSIICKEQNNTSFDEKLAHYNQGRSLKIKDQLSVLWKIAMYLRMERLGKESAYSMPLDEPEKEKCPEPHYLVEELMIWANCQVAMKLLEAFPNCTILRMQDKPREEEMAKLKEEHGATLATSLGLKNYAPPKKAPLNEVHLLQTTYQKMKSYLDRSLLRNALHYVQFEQLHPQMAVATTDVQRCERSSGSNYIVSTSDRKLYLHNALRCTQYTHFTSPIRRYIDIVVQRLLYAAIRGARCPYSQSELNEICLQINEVTQNSRNYRKDILRLDLATNLCGVSQMYVGFVQQVTEDAEIELIFADPQLKVLYKRERLIALKHFNALSIPPTQERQLSPVVISPNTVLRNLSPEPSPDESVMWQVKVASFKGKLANFFSNPEIQIVTTDALPADHKKRCAEISLFIPEGNIVSEQSSVKEHKLNAKILPHTHAMSQRSWVILQHVVSKLDLVGFRCDPDSIADKIIKEVGFNKQSNSYNMPSTITDSPCPLMIYKLHRPLQVCEVLKVHLTASPLSYVLSPSLQLIEVGPELRICIQHNSNPAECFADRLVDDASKKEYRSLEEYFRCWEQVLLSEAVSESLSESELLIVKDVTLKWPKLEDECDSFGQVTYKLNIPERKKDAGVVMELPDEFLKISYDFFKFDIGDLLCIRYNVNEEGSGYGFTLHMVIHHAEKQYKKLEGVSVIQKATFYLKFVGKTTNNISPKVAHLLQGQTSGVTYQCEVQLLPLTLPFRRIYSCLHDLRLETGVSEIAKKIALGKAGRRNMPRSIASILTPTDNSLATSLWPFQYEGMNQAKKELNTFQKCAIDIATFNSFTLIQGPPGTGKTVTGAHLAYVLTKMLRQERLRPESSKLSSSSVVIEELKPCVMYCGPSNQSVNVVLNMLTQDRSPVKDKLNILRVFSKTIEQEQYPGPKLNDQVFRKYTGSRRASVSKHDPDSKCEPQHKPFALHELVRKRNPTIAEMDAEFIKLHREGKIPSQAKRQKYYQLISATEKTVLRENVDIVLCTCNEASSRRIRANLKPVYCIVDECAMSTEPECMVPIQRADHVVLIGDHQQLRPVIKNHDAEMKGLGTSLFERYVMERENGQLQKPHMLKLQYRMHSELCKLPSEIFYRNELKTDESVTSSRRRTPEANLTFWPCGKDKPFVFVDIVGKEGREHTGQRGKAKVGLKSKFNKDEARKMAEIASVLVKQHRVSQKEIAALTPYSAQKEEIKRYLKLESLSEIQVKTVTESQGSEYGIVLLSTVRSKRLEEIKTDSVNNDGRKNADIVWLRKNLGFVADSHQICVGITRCKYGLVIVGNKTLLSYDETWRRIVKHYERNRCIKHAGNFTEPIAIHS